MLNRIFSYTIRICVYLFVSRPGLHRLAAKRKKKGKKSVRSEKAIRRTSKIT